MYLINQKFCKQPLQKTLILTLVKLLFSKRFLLPSWRREPPSSARAVVLLAPKKDKIYPALWGTKLSSFNPTAHFRLPD